LGGFLVQFGLHALTAAVAFTLGAGLRRGSAAGLPIPARLAARTGARAAALGRALGRRAALAPEAARA
jgi:hypothetical protein